MENEMDYEMIVKWLVELMLLIDELSWIIVIFKVFGDLMCVWIIYVLVVFKLSVGELVMGLVLI